MGKNGRLLTNEEEQEQRWTEHFNEVLNRPDPQHPADIHPAERDLEIEMFPPEKAEIKAVSLSKILRHYGIPEKLVKLIQIFYRNISCSVRNSTTKFTEKSGIRQGCVM